MEQTKRFAGLDGLRAVFCIGIVIYHVKEPFDAAFSEWLDPVYRYGGYFGNYIFFMLSGLLTAYHYKNRMINQKCSFRIFMAKKIAKIYPLYFCSNLCILLLDRAIPDPKRLLATCLMISTGWFDGKAMPYNFPAWFLCILLLLYMLYCLIGKISSRIPKLYLPLCILVMVWGMILMIGDWNVPFNYRTCGEGYLNFFLGVLLAELLLSGSVKQEILSAVNLLIFSGSIISVCLFGLETVSGYGGWIFSCLCANLICMALYGKYLVRLLTLPPLQIIGKVSFSIYLWHIPVVRAYLLAENQLCLSALSEAQKFILYFLILIVLSVLSYYCFEKRVLEITRLLPRHGKSGEKRRRS